MWSDCIIAGHVQCVSLLHVGRPAGLRHRGDQPEGVDYHEWLLGLLVVSYCLRMTFDFSLSLSLFKTTDKCGLYLYSPVSGLGWVPSVG